MAGLTDEEFPAHVAEATGFRHEAFDFPELRELLLPTLRADFEMDEQPGSGSLVDPDVLIAKLPSRFRRPIDPRRFSSVSIGQRR